MPAILLTTMLCLAALQSGFAYQPDGEDREGDFMDGGPKEFDFWSYALNMIVALMVVLAVIMLVLWVIRLTMGRRFALGPLGLLQVVASVPLGDRRFISVIRVGTRFYLVGISSKEITLLSELESEEVESHMKKATGPDEGGFVRVLRRLMGKAGKEAE